MDIFSNRPTRDGYDEDVYKVKKLPYQKDDLRQLKNLLGDISHKKKKQQHAFPSSFGETSFGNEKNQRVMFKSSFNLWSLDAHKKYIKTYMPQAEKTNVTEKPVLFGTDAAEYESHMVGRHFKCIISPESQEVSLEVLTREFIKRLETMTGFTFYWQACVHTDTAHRHAHLCINGKDKNGKTVYFQPDMIKRTMRETLSYVATQMVGERTPMEIAAARQHMITAKRWTKLDDTLASYTGKISVQNLPPELQNRLAFLSEQNLSVRGKQWYELKPNWKDVLVATGRYNTFLEEYQKRNGALELYAGGDVRGTCERVITFDKDESWNDAVIINDGTRHIYVPVWQLTKENLVGKTLAISGGDRAMGRQIRDRDISIVRDRKKIRGGQKDRNGL